MSTTCGRVDPRLNLLLFSAADRLDADSIILRDRRLAHLRQVARSTVGDVLRVGEIGGLTGEGRILEMDDERAILAVSLQQAPAPKIPLCLVLALPRPKMLRRILRSVAEFGVPELHLVNTYRVEKSYWHSPVLAPDAMREYLLLGLEQSRDTILPSVHCHRQFKPFVEDALPSMTAGKCALLAHPGEYPPCPREASGDTLLAIGPEGGFIPYEVEKLRAAGCQPMSLGPRTLRVENAVSSVLGRLF